MQKVTADISMQIQNTEPTYGNVSILLTYDEMPIMGEETLTNEDKYQYSIGKDNWEIAETSQITIDTEVNGEVYARYYNGIDGYKTATVTIDNIDKEKPKEFNLSVEDSENGIIIVEGTTTDIGSDKTATKYIGIQGYQFPIER